MRNRSGIREAFRASVGAMAEVAQRTRAHRRGQIIEALSEGRYTVRYQGGTIRIPSESPGDELPVGLWVTVALVEGRLAITGPSAWQGSNEIPS